MSEISGGESVFDDATEGDVSHSRADDDESDNGSADDVEESAILKPGRPSRSMKKVNAMSISSDESVSDGDDAEESSEESEDEDEDQSMSQVSLGPSEDSESDSDDADAEDDDDDEYSEDEADKADKPGKIHAESSHGEVYVEIPDLSIESISSAFNAASASESSFDVDAESESEEEAPAPPRKKSGRPSNATTNASRGSNGSTATARGRRSSNKSRSSQRDASILLEASALTDLSDASMVMEEKSPKKSASLARRLPCKKTTTSSRLEIRVSSRPFIRVRRVGTRRGRRRASVAAVGSRGVKLRRCSRFSELDLIRFATSSSHRSIFFPLCVQTSAMLRYPLLLNRL